MVNNRIYHKYIIYYVLFPDAFFIIGKRGQHNSGPSGDGITLANEGGR